jgi:ABC-type bacteriocin/lantibiotic exporter with double-glycine peptidase domain/8-oxo-dGTP pyrophosphatase MutT (NUDIX family)
MSRQRLRHVSQLEAADCGAACVAMVLGGFGRRHTVPQIRRAIPSGRDGTSAFDLIRGAATFGLDLTGVRVEPERLAELPPGSILHWRDSHFVVLKRVGRRHVDVLDPATGQQRLTRADAAGAFSGVALLPALDASVPYVASARTSRLAQMLRSEWRRWAAVAGVSVAAQASLFLLPLLSGYVLDKVVIPGRRGALPAAVAAGALLALFFALTAWCRGRLTVRLRYRLDLSFSSGFVRHLMSLPLNFFSQRTGGDLLMRANSNVAVREIVNNSVMTSVPDSVATVVYLVVITLVQPVIGLVALVTTAALLTLPMLTRPAYVRASSHALERRAQAQTHITRIIQGIEDIKVGGVEQPLYEHWRGLYEDELDAIAAQARVTVWLDALSQAVRLAAPVVILGLAASLVLHHGITAGQMLVLASGSLALFASVSSLAATIQQLQNIGVYGARLDDVLEEPPEVGRGLPALPSARQVELRDVTYSYPGAGSPAVDAVSFTAGPERRVAIVGATGSGKSTLLRVVAGLLEPASGQVLVDGVDRARYDIASLRARWAMVPQAVRLFPGTIGSNIALYRPDASRRQLERAASIACVLEDIQALPLGFDTPIADDGATLSGGQRQRLGIARALCREPEMLLLDEATSNLDPATEAELFARVLATGCGVVMTTHRLDLARRADEVLVLDGGRVVDRGAFDDLAARPGALQSMLRPTPTPTPTAPAALAVPAVLPSLAAGQDGQPARRLRTDGLVLPPEPVAPAFVERVGALCDAPFVSSVLLLGSQVTGTNHAGSNADLVFFVDSMSGALPELQSIKHRVSTALGVPVSINVHRTDEVTNRLHRWSLFTHKNRAELFVLQAKYASVRVAGADLFAAIDDPAPRAVREEAIRVLAGFTYSLRKFALDASLAPHGDREFIRTPLIALEYIAAFYGYLAQGHLDALAYLHQIGAVDDADHAALLRCSARKRGHDTTALDDDARGWSEDFIYRKWKELLDQFWRHGVGDIRWDGEAPVAHWDITRPQCAAMVVVHRGDDILLTRRPANDYLYPGLWTVPGGYLEAHETPLAAARREVCEEIGVGLVCVPVGDRPVVSDRLAAFAFEARLDDGELAGLGLTEHDAAAFVPAQEVSDLELTPEARLVIDAWLVARKPSLL